MNQWVSCSSFTMLGLKNQNTSFHLVQQLILKPKEEIFNYLLVFLSHSAVLSWFHYQDRKHSVFSSTLGCTSQEDWAVQYLNKLGSLLWAFLSMDTVLRSAPSTRMVSIIHVTLKEPVPIHPSNAEILQHLTTNLYQDHFLMLEFWVMLPK